MALINFIDISLGGAITLILVGFVGGLVSGFIGSGGAFVLTPAMMALGAPGMIAVATNSCHKFPKAIVGVFKRHKYGQVDVKLGLVMAVFAEAGVLFGKHMMTSVRNSYGAVGTDLYVSAIFIVTMAVVGSFMLKDYRKLKAMGDDAQKTQDITWIARWVQSIRIPGTMFYSRGVQAEISFLFVIPLGFATGFLSSAIAVGGLIGVPGMIYVLGVPAIMASATEMVIAVATGLGATFLYGLEGAVDIRMAMLILLGSLFGIQIGAIGTTYVKDYQIKFTMAVIMLTVLFSRIFYIPGYLNSVGMIEPLPAGTLQVLKWIGDGVMYLALFLGAYTVFSALFKGMKKHRESKSGSAGETAAD
ncbi:MAG: sulfite exporter TauE/SafE family protein [Hydrogenophilales bacterium CG_4_9_14_3_um_filter_63_34]|nr:MAG: sulfite exporter TauE/SafE family protein [Hydrogenophilales bacterium CG_4_9_14_3_um_filter_63_34]